MSDDLIKAVDLLNRMNEGGWQISSDPAEKLDYGTDTILNPLKEWIGQYIRTIKLPELLIEVDNDLKFSRFFMSVADQSHSKAQHVCESLATIMAHASEIGPYTMAQLTEGITYNRMKHITDWHMHEDTQRSALAEVVNAISRLDITKAWGDGTTSSSDGQRFPLRRKVLHKSYSHAFNDFALEFYNFVADNYAPYFSVPHECADRDAPFVLYGLLYNESDLNIEEHYTDTHGFTDINFAAFAMFGKRFVPRIRGLQKQAIFRTDTCNIVVVIINFFDQSGTILLYHLVHFSIAITNKKADQYKNHVHLFPKELVYQQMKNLFRVQVKMM